MTKTEFETKKNSVDSKISGINTGGVVNLTLKDSVASQQADNFINRSNYIIKNGICYLNIYLRNYQYKEQTVIFNERVPKPFTQLMQVCVSDGNGNNGKIVVTVETSGILNIYNGSIQGLYHTVIAYPILKTT